jgi:hypothetical protein
MYIFRFFACIIAFGIAVLTSYITEIELFKVLALFGFLLVVDTITVRFLSRLYMQAVYKEMEEAQIEKMKDGKNDSSSR